MVPHAGAVRSRVIYSELGEVSARQVEVSWRGVFIVGQVPDVVGVPSNIIQGRKSIHAAADGDRAPHSGAEDLVPDSTYKSWGGYFPQIQVICYQLKYIRNKKWM